MNPSDLRLSLFPLLCSNYFSGQWKWQYSHHSRTTHKNELFLLIALVNVHENTCSFVEKECKTCYVLWVWLGLPYLWKADIDVYLFCNIVCTSTEFYHILFWRLKPSKSWLFNLIDAVILQSDLARSGFNSDIKYIRVSSVTIIISH